MTNIFSWIHSTMTRTGLRPSKLDTDPMKCAEENSGPQVTLLGQFACIGWVVKNFSRAFLAWILIPHLFGNNTRFFPGFVLKLKDCVREFLPTGVLARSRAARTSLARQRTSRPSTGTPSGKGTLAWRSATRAHDIGWDWHYVGPLFVAFVAKALRRAVQDD